MGKKTDERSTPDDLFNELHTEFHFDVDLFASDSMHKLPKYYTKQNSAFRYKWLDNNFANPPYSELRKCVYYATIQKALTVFILPCDTSTQWFHRYLWDKKIHKPRPNIELRFPEGRYKFNDSPGQPKFATIIAIINNKDKE